MLDDLDDKLKKLKDNEEKLYKKNAAKSNLTFLIDNTSISISRHF